MPAILVAQRCPARVCVQYIAIVLIPCWPIHHILLYFSFAQLEEKEERGKFEGTIQRQFEIPTSRPTKAPKPESSSVQVLLNQPCYIQYRHLASTPSTSRVRYCPRRVERIPPPPKPSSTSRFTAVTSLASTLSPTVAIQCRDF